MPYQSLPICDVLKLWGAFLMSVSSKIVVCGKLISFKFRKVVEDDRVTRSFLVQLLPTLINTAFIGGVAQDTFYFLLLKFTVTTPMCSFI